MIETLATAILAILALGAGVSAGWTLADLIHGRR